VRPQSRGNPAEADAIALSLESLDHSMGNERELVATRTEPAAKSEPAVSAKQAMAARVAAARVHAVRPQSRGNPAEADAIYEGSEREPGATPKPGAKSKFASNGSDETTAAKAAAARVYAVLPKSGQVLPKAREDPPSLERLENGTAVGYPEDCGPFSVLGDSMGCEREPSPILSEKGARGNPAVSASAREMAAKAAAARVYRREVLPKSKKEAPSVESPEDCAPAGCPGDSMSSERAPSPSYTELAAKAAKAAVSARAKEMAAKAAAAKIYTIFPKSKEEAMAAAARVYNPQSSEVLPESWEVLPESWIEDCMPSATHTELCAKSTVAASVSAKTIAAKAVAARAAVARCYAPKSKEPQSVEYADDVREKLQVCTHVYDFRDAENSRKEKETKTQTLLELVEYVSSAGTSFSAPFLQDVVALVRVNIFRASGPKSSDAEAADATLERAWQHLQLVYELFARLVVSNDVNPNIAMRFVDQAFVLKFLELFDTDDARERDYLKTILHGIYAKFIALRPFIRHAIQNTLFEVIYECDTHNGVGELLEIIGSIVNGFALPLKDEHREFLTSTLIPLYKVEALTSFHQQLSYCIGQYVEKDPRLVYDVIASMLKFWPVSTTSKQILFLNELEEILEVAEAPEFERVLDLLFHRVALCITSPHFQLCERMLLFWNNDHIVSLMDQNRPTLYPIVIGALQTASKQHWSAGVHAKTSDILNLLMDADRQLFDECSSGHRLEAQEDDLREELRQRKWAQLKAAFPVL